MRIKHLLTMFLGPQYRRYIIFGNSGGVPLWEWTQWLKCAEILTDVLALVDKPISLHSRQGHKQTERGIRFGRLGWKHEDFAKWCHRSPETEGVSDNWYFVDAEIFCPSRNECLKKGTLPTAYIQLMPEPENEDSHTAYDQELHLLFRDSAESFWWRHRVELENCVRALAKVAGGLLVVTSEQTIWSLNEFESLPYIYRGMHLDPVPDVSRLKGKWTAMPLEGP